MRTHQDRIVQASCRYVTSTTIIGSTILYVYATVCSCFVVQYSVPFKGQPKNFDNVLASFYNQHNSYPFCLKMSERVNDEITHDLRDRSFFSNETLCKSTNSNLATNVTTSSTFTTTNGKQNPYEANVVASSSSFFEGSVGEAIRRLGGSHASSKPTVWTEFSRIAASAQRNQHDTLLCNLGQGFPNWAPPKFAIDSLVDAAMNPSHHQYTRPAGHPYLVKQLARRYSMHLHRAIDEYLEVAVTVGASQALYLSLQTLIQPGDEVILFEPFFDLYVNQVKLAGGTPVYVPLEFVPYAEDSENGTIAGGSWILNAEALKGKVNSQRTKAIILNSPHNPTGKVFTRIEMEHIAESLEFAHPDCVVLSDEVYKYIIHAPPPESSTRLASSPSLHCVGHVHFASLPGMWDRTITISSAGKTFSATGWQIGWCVGPKHLIARIQTLLPYVQFCASTVMQEALARTLTIADEPYMGYPSYYDYLRNIYIRKRNLLVSALEQAGFGVPDYSQTAGGGFFIFARVGKDVIDCLPKDRIMVSNPAAPGGIARQDWALCQWMAEEMGLLCIPSSPFFSESSAVAGVSDGYIRIAFCKTDETIEKAAEILQQLMEVKKTTEIQRANNEKPIVGNHRNIQAATTISTNAINAQ